MLVPTLRDAAPPPPPGPGRPPGPSRVVIGPAAILPSLHASPRYGLVAVGSLGTVPAQAQDVIGGRWVDATVVAPGSGGVQQVAAARHPDVADGGGPDEGAGGPPQGRTETRVLCPCGVTRPAGQQDHGPSAPAAVYQLRGDGRPGDSGGSTPAEQLRVLNLVRRAFLRDPTKRNEVHAEQEGSVLNGFLMGTGGLFQSLRLACVAPDPERSGLNAEIRDLRDRRAAACELLEEVEREAAAIERALREKTTRRSDLSRPAYGWCGVAAPGEDELGDGSLAQREYCRRTELAELLKLRDSQLAVVQQELASLRSVGGMEGPFPRGPTAAPDANPGGFDRCGPAWYRRRVQQQAARAAIFSRTARMHVLITFLGWKQRVWLRAGAKRVLSRTALAMSFSRALGIAEVVLNAWHGLLKAPKTLPRQHRAASLLQAPAAKRSRGSHRLVEGLLAYSESTAVRCEFLAWWRFVRDAKIQKIASQQAPSQGPIPARQLQAGARGSRDGATARRRLVRHFAAACAGKTNAILALCLACWRSEVQLSRLQKLQVQEPARTPRSESGSRGRSATRGPPEERQLSREQRRNAELHAQVTRLEASLRAANGEAGAPPLRGP